jgi:AraC-like DNA-binding protein
MGLHFFRAETKWISSHRKGELAELIVMLSGVYIARNSSSRDAATLRATAGDIVYWPANTERTEENDPANPTECIALYFRWPGAPAGLPRKIRDSGGIIRLLAIRLLAIKEEPVLVPVPIWRAYLGTILGEFVRLSMAKEDPLVAQVADFIEQHLAQPFTLDDLAAAVGLNRFYLGRAFKVRTGLTPMDYVKRKRVEHALGMLATDDRFSLRMVAARAGINDDAQLRRLLKRYTGINARTLVKLAREKRTEPYRWRITDPPAKPDWQRES